MFPILFEKRIHSGNCNRYKQFFFLLHGNTRHVQKTLDDKIHLKENAGIASAEKIKQKGISIFSSHEHEWANENDETKKNNHLATIKLL